MILFCGLAILVLIKPIRAYSINLISQQNCSVGSADSNAEYFNSANLVCVKCSQNFTFQKQSEDGFSCVCQPGYKTIKNFGGGNVNCVKCADGETVSDDGLFCIPCRAGSYMPATKSCSTCPSDSISVYLDQSGTSLASQTCIMCSNNTMPINSTCLTCRTTIKMLRASSLPESCTCPNSHVDGVCFPGITPTTTSGSSSASSTSPVVPTGSDTFTLILPAGETSSQTGISSKYFETQARSATAFCSTAYNNITACQLLANLCTLQLNTLYGIGIESTSTCSEFQRLSSQRTSISSDFTSWVVNMPWIYYSPAKGSTILKDTTLKTIYSPNDNLQIYLAAYEVNGKFIGYQDASQGGQLQLCKDTSTRMKAAFQFATKYKQTCELNVDDLFDNEKYPLIFYDPYIYYYDNTTQKSQLVPIPIRNTAVIDKYGKFPNVITTSDQNSLNEALALGNTASAVSIEASIQDKWELTRRIFMVDNFAGKTSSTSKLPQLVRYASNIEIKVISQDSVTDGQILPPVITIDYSNLYATNDYGKGKKAHITFSVTYSGSIAKQAAFDQALRIAVGSLSTLAACFSMIRTWIWSRRAGVLRLDAMLIIKLILFSAGNIANAFLIVIYFVSIYFLIFYKVQSVYLISLPNSDDFILIYIAIAFILKLIDLIHLIAVQCTMDIFLIDWEPPKFNHNITNISNNGNNNTASNTELQSSSRSQVLGRYNITGDVTDDLELRYKREFKSSLPSTTMNYQLEDTGISVWRLIYVANEWNEIQTYRKTSYLITISSVLILMQVIGLENLASSDAKSNVVVNLYDYQSSQNRIFRIALVLSIFALSGIIQWFISVTLWERCFSDKLRSFADLCSVTNISVFIFAQSNFGYYIHGHSPTGRSDVDLGGITQMLSIENEGIAPKRGITPDSHDHTYRMALPSGLRQTFDRLYAPLLDLTMNIDKRTGKHTSPQAITNEAYQNINRYLKRFISRDDPDGLRYRIVRRKAFEDILDGEFDDTTFEGLFYIDDGNSFGDVLFYGNEWLLFTFDTVLFCLVDLLSQNLILSGFFVILIGSIFNLVRNDLGRRNTARKTLVDERFLI
ncbi:hypothetical protein MN116_008200 [Schistosoma mekongi]|uniref:Meckelin n=1 Tax=Schistosoma mekongi TaxID=38744 RepID=A0AAE1Z703_SCHME|nr:hypothetical protein MN116_008200 [Schistosoma mekongi]